MINIKYRTKNVSFMKVYYQIMSNLEVRSINREREEQIIKSNNVERFSVNMHAVPTIRNSRLWMYVRERKRMSSSYGKGMRTGI